MAILINIWGRLGWRLCVSGYNIAILHLILRTMENELRIIKRTFSQWLKLSKSNLTAVDFVCSLMISNMKTSDPVWGYLIGPPGSAKSEILRSFIKHKSTEYVSDLTPRAIISGFRGGGHGSDPSLLPLWNNKILIIKDFATILSKPRDQREIIISTLRECYDGDFSFGTGTIGVVSHHSRFGIIAAVTCAIDTYWSVHQQLGERFISFRFEEQDRMMSTNWASVGTYYKKRMRREMRRASMKFLNYASDVSKVSNPQIPKKIHDRLCLVADMIARARSMVARSGYTKAITYIPVPEVGTRLIQQLKSMMVGRAISCGRDSINGSDYRFALRIARDTLPSIIANYLETIYWAYKRPLMEGKTPPTITVGFLSAILPFSTTTIRYHCEDLTLLNILKKKGAGVRTSWEPNPEFYHIMDKTGIWYM